MTITLRIGGAWSPETLRRYLRHVASKLHTGDVETGNTALEDELATALYDAVITRDASAPGRNA